MAQRNDEETVATIRRMIDAFNRGDYDGATEIAHPDVELVRSWEKSSLRGPAAIREWLKPDAFTDQRLELGGVTVAGDKALLSQHLYAKGAESGIDMDVESWAVWTLDEDGRGIRLELFLWHEEAQARAAAGLEPEPA
jgi:ketosteroid isomerase-like protein